MSETQGVGPGHETETELKLKRTREGQDRTHNLIIWGRHLVRSGRSECQYLGQASGAVYWTPVTAYPTPWPFTKDTKILAFANLEVTCAGVAQATSRGSGVALFTTLSPWNQIRTMLSSPLSWETKRSFGSHLLTHQGKTHQSNRFKFLRSAGERSITSVGFPSVLHWSFALSFSLTPLFYLELSYKLYAFR